MRQQGIVVTNNHVIDGADEINVILSDNTSIRAELLGTDPRTDIAVLRIRTDKPLTAVPWGNSDEALVGDWVIAIGNPFGLGGSVTAGIVSARGRDIRQGLYDDFIQTDAAINRGNSGGPLFNMAGQVIGINTAIYSPSGGSIGIGFSIPSNLAQRIVAQLRDGGRVRRGWLGVNIQQVTDEIAESAAACPTARAARWWRARRKAGRRPRAASAPATSSCASTARRCARCATCRASSPTTSVGTQVPVVVWRDGKEETVHHHASANCRPSRQQAAATAPAAPAPARRSN